MLLLRDGWEEQMAHNSQEILGEREFLRLIYCSNYQPKWERGIKPIKLNLTYESEK